MTRHPRPRRAAAFVAAAFGLALITGCGGSAPDGQVIRPGSGRPTAPKPGLNVLADLEKVLPKGVGFPQVVASDRWVVAIRGTDYERDDSGEDPPATPSERPTTVAVSNDGGRSFETIPFAPHLFSPSAVIDGDDAVVVGQRCLPTTRDQDPGTSCLASEPVRAYRLALRLGGLTRLRDLGSDASADAIGVGSGRPAFSLRKNASLQIAELQPDGEWSFVDVPSPGHQPNGDVLCETGTDLVRMVPEAAAKMFPGGNGGPAPVWTPPVVVGDPLVPADAATPASNRPVAVGDPLVTAWVSHDRGLTWGAPSTFHATRESRLPGGLHGSCGSSSVVAVSGEGAVFDPASARWTPIDLADESVDPVATCDFDSAFGSNPSSLATVWTGASAVAIIDWSTNRSVRVELGATSVARASGLELDPSSPCDRGGPAPPRSSLYETSASNHGFVLVRGDRGVSLGFIR